VVEIDVTTETPTPPPKRSASLLIAAGIMLSRLSGLVRESTFAAFLGLGAAADAFGAATRIPNVLQMLLGEGTLSASFIPVYSAELDRDEQEAGRIAGAVATLLALVAALVIVISLFAAEPIAWTLAPGFRDDARFGLTITLMRFTFPAAGLLVLSAWCLGILNSHRHFFLSYVSPVLWNIAQIAAVAGAVIFFGAGDFDGTVNELADIDTNVEVLGEVAKVAAWGFLVGAGLQFLVQIRNVSRLAKGLRFRLDLGRRGVRDVIGRFWGAVLGRGVVQISAMIDTVLASLLIAGAVGALVKAQVLYVLPISIFATSVAAAELPELSRLKSAEDWVSTNLVLRVVLGGCLFPARRQDRRHPVRARRVYRRRHLVDLVQFGRVLTWTSGERGVPTHSEHALVPGRHEGTREDRDGSCDGVDHACRVDDVAVRPTRVERCARCPTHAVRRW